MQLEPIGHVRSAWTALKEIPMEGVPAQVIVSERHAGALAGVELSSHLIVVGWFHELGKLHLENTRGRFVEVGPSRGSFATRSPSRPNPLSLSIARLVERRGNVLHLDRLDLVDGTPVVDLKPYIPGEDSIFSSMRVRRIPHASMAPATLTTFLGPILERHLGSRAGDPSARSALGAVLRAVTRFGVDPRHPDLAVRVSRADAAADAVMALTGATFASGRFELSPCAGPLRFRFTYQGQVLDLDATEETPE